MKNKMKLLLITAMLFLLSNAVSLAAETYKVGNIEFTNLKELPKDLLVSKLPVHTGDSYSNKSLSDIYLALLKLGYVSNINIYPVIEGNNVNLTIEVDEANNALDTARQAETGQDLTKKTEYKIASVEIVGANQNQYISKVPLKVGEYFVPQDMINGAKALFETGLFESVDPQVERGTDNTINVKYVVVQNPIIKSVKIIGNTLYSEADLKKALGVEEGQVLDGNLLDPTNNGIVRKYTDAGYSLVKIQKININNDGDLEIELTEGIVDSITYSKVLPKKEGQRRSQSEKLLKTRDYLFQRIQDVQVGQVYNKANLESTIRELYRTGLFTSIEPELQGKEGDPNARSINLLVEERPTASINGTISYGTSVGLVGGIKFTDSNFLGKGQEATLNMEISNEGNKTFEIGLFDPWLRGTDRIQGGWTLYWKQTKDEDAIGNDLYKVKKAGAKFTLGKGLNSDLYVRTALRFESISEQEADRDIRDRYNLIAITPGFTYDTRDNSFNPKKGVYTSLNYEFGKITTDKREYSQIVSDMRLYHKTLFKDKNTMAYRMVYGYTGGDTPEALRFSVGGSESIRGYDSGIFDGYNQFYINIENRTQINNFMQLVAFFDMGNAWQSNSKEPNRKDANSFKDLKKGAGIGVRLNTPVGPLRFDYGWPLDSVRTGLDKEGAKFYFSFGQTF